MVFVTGTTLCRLNGTVNPCTATYASSAYTIEIPEWCDPNECAAGTSHKLEVVQAENPGFKIPTAVTVAIKTYNVVSGTNYTVDITKTTVDFSPGLEPGALTATSVTK